MVKLAAFRLADIEDVDLPLETRLDADDVFFCLVGLRNRKALDDDLAMDEMSQVVGHVTDVTTVGDQL